MGEYDIFARIVMAGDLVDVRDTQRDLAGHFGEPWPTESVRKFMDVLTAKHEKTGESILEIAARGAENATKAGKGMVALTFVAAAVELIDPTVTKD